MSAPHEAVVQRSNTPPRLSAPHWQARWAGALGLILTSVFFGMPAASAAQTISGRLLDLDTDRPVPLGLVMMFSSDGDSITATVADEVGRFTVSAPEPGSFVLLATALGYEETPAGVFELGPGGAMEVEYRLPSAPLPIDAVLVSIDRPVLEHHLVRNGFVRRLQRGLGRFITPYDIERSPARSTESLLEGIPQVRVGTVRGPVLGVGLPMPHLGEAIQIMAPQGGWCVPQIYVDGLNMRYDPSQGFTLSQYAHLETVEAIEVYRRPAEIPVEFAPGTQSVTAGLSHAQQFSGAGQQTGCGMIIVWTKLGLAAGQRPESFEVDEETGEPVGLPEVGVTGPMPRAGERVRLELEADEALARGIRTPWEGTVEAIDDVRVIGVDARTGSVVVLPVDAISNLQVSRQKGSFDAWRRGLVGGTAIGLGTWGFLSLLCEWTCGATADQDTLTPGIIIGVLTGAFVVTRGPGDQWVRATRVGLEPGPEPRSVGLSLSWRFR